MTFSRDELRAIARRDPPRGRVVQADLDLSRTITERLPYIQASVATLVRNKQVREDGEMHLDLIAAIELLQAASARLIIKTGVYAASNT